MKNLTLLFLTLLASMIFGHELQAQPNYVLLFDGQNDYVDLGTSVGDGVRTVELWFKPESNIGPNLSETQTLIMRSNAGNNIDEFGLCFPESSWIGAGQLRFHYTDNTNSFNAVYSNQNTWNGGQWYHVAGVIDPIQGMKLYIDGQLQTSTFTSFTKATDPSFDNMDLGVWGNYPHRYWLGEIEDVRISAVAEYSANFTPPCQDIALGTAKAVYHFNEGSGLFAIDSSGNGYHGIINGATYLQDSSCRNAVNNTPPISILNVEAFPNPFSDEATITIAEVGPSYDFSLYNVMGESVWQSFGIRSGSVRLDGNGLDPGMYFLRYSSDTGRTGMKRMIVQ